MRLFVAINFDAKTKENILSVQSRLRALGSGSFSHPENLHLTLAFLGQVAPTRLLPARQAMDNLRFAPIPLQFTHMGCFNRDGGDIWWLGLAENNALTALQKALSAQLNNHGFAPESRRFSPHITLARQVFSNEIPDKNRLLENPFSTTADTVSLMLSERVGGKLTYTEQYAVSACEKEVEA